MTLSDDSMAVSYTVTGTVRAMYNATLSSKVMGRVLSIAVREGDMISTGQTLIRIDPRELQAAANMASANYNASVVGVGSAKTAAQMEAKTSVARIAQAEAAVTQAQAAVAAAEARRDLALAGPRTQEVTQSHLAVTQAESNLRLAKVEYERSQKLFDGGVIARQELDQAQNRFEVAKSQYDAALQGESIAKEGSRKQDIRAAEEAVAQARAALKQAQSGVQQARAAAMQVDVRRKDIEVANAQVKQAAAAIQSAQVGLSYSSVSAPFAGRVVKRLVDPGSMASPGVPLLEVEGGEFRLEAVVPEKQLASLTVGSHAPVVIGDAKGEGIVAEIVPQGDAMSHSFIVKFKLANVQGVKSGMFGRAMVATGDAKRLTIPASATWQREGLHYVFALNKEGIARLRIVTVGDTMGDRIEVLSGLNLGEKIVVGNREKVADGDKVEGN